jgi:hypothetical protein
MNRGRRVRMTEFIVVSFAKSCDAHALCRTTPTSAIDAALKKSGMFFSRLYQAGVRVRE